MSSFTKYEGIRNICFSNSVCIKKIIWYIKVYYCLKDFYSDFYTTLTSKHPELTLNDLRFIAMVKLNFSNKEIAQYGNMSIRTVESKKYRLRKKLDLPADLDFNQWVLGQ